MSIRWIQIVQTFTEISNGSSLIATCHILPQNVLMHVISFSFRMSCYLSLSVVKVVDLHSDLLLDFRVQWGVLLDVFVSDIFYAQNKTNLFVRLILNVSCKHARDTNFIISSSSSPFPMVNAYTNRHQRWASMSMRERNLLAFGKFVNSVGNQEMYTKQCNEKSSHISIQCNWLSLQCNTKSITFANSEIRLYQLFGAFLLFRHFPVLITGTTHNRRAQWCVDISGNIISNFPNTMQNQ